MKTLDQVQYVPQVSFLADEDMLRAYQEEIKSYSERAQNSLNIFTFDNEVIKGSNLFGNILLVSEHLVLPSQVLTDSELNPEFFRGNYEDLGLVIRTNGDSWENNDHNAKNLYEQLKQRGFTPSEDAPVMISLRGLSLEEDKDSHYGLIHKLTDEAQIVQAPELSYKNNGNKFKKVDERGVPIFDNNGTRTFYARQGGLGGVCLDRDLDLGSYWGWGRVLDYSDADGRVAVAKNLDTYTLLQIKETLKDLGFSDLTEDLIAKLNK